MPLSLRFVVPLALALAAIAYAVVPLVDRFTFQWFVRDLDARGAVIAKTGMAGNFEVKLTWRSSDEETVGFPEDAELQGSDPVA